MSAGAGQLHRTCRAARHRGNIVDNLTPVGAVLVRPDSPASASCRVLNQDFLEYASPEPYDAIVILGVMEHLPDYPAVLRQFQRLLKPGGRVYFDASAFREKRFSWTRFCGFLA